MGEGVCTDPHPELEGRPITRGCRSCYIAELREALRGLLHHNAGEITCECCQADTHDCVFCRARAALGLP